MSLTMSIFTFYMFVYMYVHALTPPACGLSFICNKVLFCSVLYNMSVCICLEQYGYLNNSCLVSFLFCFVLLFKIYSRTSMARVPLEP